MFQRWTHKTTAGLLLWMVGLTVAAWLLQRADQNQQVSEAAQRLETFWTTPQVEESAEAFGGVPIQYNDPVFRVVDGRFERIAQVIQTTPGYVQSGQAVKFRLFGIDRAEWEQGHLEIHRPARNLGRVAEVMLTDERIDRIRIILEQAQQEHQQQVIEELTPLFREALQELRPVLEKELLRAIQDHRPELDALVDKYKEHILQEKLIPVVESDVVPVVQNHAQPLMEKMGGKMWKRLSLWRFAWRFVYDESLAPQQPLVNQEWQRFLKNEAIPIVRQHSDEIVAMQAAIIEDLTANPRVRQVLRESLDEVANDDDAKQLVRDILQDGLTKNARVQAEIQQFFKDPKTQAALRKVSDRFEPYAVQIGQELFGTPDQVTREFALVLRHMILKKDQRWLVWKPGRPAGLPADQPFENGIPMYWTGELGMPPFFPATEENDDWLEDMNQLPASIQPTPIEKTGSSA